MQDVKTSEGGEEEEREERGKGRGEEGRTRGGREGIGMRGEE